MPCSADHGGGAAGDPARAMATAGAAGLLMLAPACAKQEPPPGHRPDSRPPAVTAISPASGSVVEDFGGALIIRFDEPLSRPGGLERQLQGSPAHRYRVDVGHSAIRIRPQDGWRRNAVYRIVVSGTLSDILGNRREEPIEVTFSTGPPITATRVAGKVWDRVSGRGVQDARVLFVATEGDSVPYTVVSDREGAFRLPAVPPDSYRAYGFMDRNRNLRLDRGLESSDSTTFVLQDSTSSVSVDLVLLEPDSTPPVLALLEVPDSARIRLTFDDYLLPGQELPPDAVTVADTLTGTRWPIRGSSVLTAGEAQAGPEEAPETEAGTGEPPETGAPEGRTGVADEPGPAAARDTSPGGRGQSPVEPLPSQVVEIRLGRPLEEGSYRLRIPEVLNLNRVPGRGDTTFVYPSSDGEDGSDRREEQGGR